MNRVNFGPQPFMYPMPVLIIATYDENGTADAMNAAWGGITDNNVHTAEFRSYHDGNYWNRIGGTPEPARRISGTTQ